MCVDRELSGAAGAFCASRGRCLRAWSGGTKVSDEENTLEAFFFDVWKSLKGLSSLKPLCLAFFSSFLFYFFFLLGETFIDVLWFL